MKENTIKIKIIKTTIAKTKQKHMLSCKTIPYHPAFSQIQTIPKKVQNYKNETRIWKRRKKNPSKYIQLLLDRMLAASFGKKKRFESFKVKVAYEFCLYVYLSIYLF